MGRTDKNRKNNKALFTCPAYAVIFFRLVSATGQDCVNVNPGM